MSAYNMHADGFTFEVPGDVVPKERPRVQRMRGRHVTETPRRTAAYETLVGMHAMLATATWARAYRKAWDRSARYAVHITLHRSTRRRFDIDNAAKSLLDGGIGGVWIDDAQVDELTVVRGDVRSSSPRTVVTVRRLATAVAPPGGRKAATATNRDPRSSKPEMAPRGAQAAESL